MKSSSILTIAGVTLLSGAIAYAIYFDSMRRNDAAFRKRLRKEKKKVEKSSLPASSSSPSTTTTSGPLNITEAELRAAIEKVKAEPMPTAPEEKEQYFMQQVNLGESLCQQGPAFSLPAASCFFRALRVYPSPVELIMIYQQTVPEPIFKLVMEMTQLDVKARIEGYYDHFPPKEMNTVVKAVDIPDGSGTAVRKRILVVNKDFKAGDVVYKEDPIVAALDDDLEGKGVFCSHCFKTTILEDSISPSGDKFGPTYCSKGCELKSTTQSQNLLFGSAPPVPPELNSQLTPESAIKRTEAQSKFVELIKNMRKASTVLLARFVARQVSGELAKMLPGVAASGATNDFGSAEFTLYDHMERLRYLELEVSDDEANAFREVLESTFPGLDQFINDERYATLKGKMVYNSYGVYFGEGRNDKPDTGTRPEDIERTRIDVGTSKQIGTAFYFVSSYLQHNCNPSSHVAFPEGTNALTLIASRDLKEGDELTVAYVDVKQREAESIVDARRRRRHELARGWRFSCPCERCNEEGASLKDKEVESQQQDESKLEPAVENRDKKEHEEFVSNID